MTAPRYAADISYPLDKEHLVFGLDRIAENPGGYGFHYAPYNFDSGPESDFFEKVLRLLNLDPAEVQDVYFTGAVTDPAKTDLTFAYRDADGRIRHYTPDFVVRNRDGHWLLVEIKMTAKRNDPVEGTDGLKAKALGALAGQNSDLLSTGWSSPTRTWTHAVWRWSASSWPIDRITRHSRLDCDGFCCHTSSKPSHDSRK